ncbi:hypothetical protein PTHTG4_30870 [Parageobacillus thermoglucosidasius]|nr:hypothetical protein PTHTG4_30870 [Parageobacillus thermoglucosidasius]
MKKEMYFAAFSDCCIGKRPHLILHYLLHFFCVKRTNQEIVAKLNNEKKDNDKHACLDNGAGHLFCSILKANPAWTAATENGMKKRIATCFAAICFISFNVKPSLDNASYCLLSCSKSLYSLKYKMLSATKKKRALTTIACLILICCSFLRTRVI